MRLMKLLTIIPLDHKTVIALLLCFDEELGT
jgi:hypothetical protein